MDGIRRSLVLAAPSLALTACAARPASTSKATPFQAPAPGVGDRWAYRLVNRYNGQEGGALQMQVNAVGPLEIAVHRDGETGPMRSPGTDLRARYLSPWSVAVEPSYDLVLQFAEPVPMLPPRLSVGESASTHTRFTVPGYSGTYDWRQRLRATGEETVTVPAGTFRTLVVRRDIWFEYPDWFRLRSMREDTLWYAPEVNGWVRREWTGRYQTQSLTRGWHYEDWVGWELTGYRRGAA